MRCIDDESWFVTQLLDPGWQLDGIQSSLQARPADLIAAGMLQRCCSHCKAGVFGLVSAPHPHAAGFTST